MGAGGFARKRDRKAPRRALRLDLVDVAARAGIGDELDLRRLESQSGERYGGGHIRVLRIEQRRPSGPALAEQRWLCERAEDGDALRDRAPPGDGRLRRAAP